MDKKNEEKKILGRFIKESSLGITVLDISTAQKTFPNYTGENPDFIITFHGQILGLELFSLCPTKSREPIQYGDRTYVNPMHKEANFSNYFSSMDQLEKRTEMIKKCPEKFPLPVYENITTVLKERLGEKDGKINNYVTKDNWFLIYVDEKFNTGMEELCEDNIQDKIESVIRNIAMENESIKKRVKRIILYEPDSDGQKCLYVDIA